MDNPNRFTLIVNEQDNFSYRIVETKTERVLEFRKQEVTSLAQSVVASAEVVHINISFDRTRNKEVDSLLSSLQGGCRISSYNAHTLMSSTISKCFKRLAAPFDIVSYLSLFQKT